MAQSVFVKLKLAMAQSSSYSTIDNKKEKVVVCNCNIEAKGIQAWTVDDPGRRFYTCEGRRVSNGYQTCNFFRWYEVENPHGWQYTALLGARNVIRQQKEDISNLRNQVRELSLENVRIGGAVRLENESSGQLHLIQTSTVKHVKRLEEKYWF
ncbi:uncharacterized protein LOC106405762 [Brassica napus]|nr:PREDICTED: uncharacterized protein LOC106314184 [Brassica oleracea var. oleracea]XP_048623557.1 uncharacterized protein LOC106405762 [Brassica napus]